jgi:predicted DNA-binding transcriptional regulator AlpA
MPTRKIPKNLSDVVHLRLTKAEIFRKDALANIFFASRHVEVAAPSNKRTSDRPKENLGRVSDLLSATSLRYQRGMKGHTTANDDAPLWRVADVRKHFGCSAMWIWRKTKEAGFPKAFKLGSERSARYWKREDVLAWAAQYERRAA